MSALDFLQTLVGLPLLYGIKSPDMDLYDFGFGEKVNCTYALHVVCRFKVIHTKGDYRVDRYFEDTPCEQFHMAISSLIGMKVNRVALSDKNDLWLDFGDYKVVFATFENEEESWRFFTTNTNDPHLVASNSHLTFV